jgi:hypothetical protein
MAKFVYADNSNIWIEGKFHLAVAHGRCPNVEKAHENKISEDWRYDFGRLLEVACRGDVSDIKRAVLYGSRPTDNDSLWNAAKRVGFEVFAPERNAGNKEKGVDAGLIMQAAKDVYSGAISAAADEVILILGDADYFPLIEALNEYDIPVTLVFWNNAAQSLRAGCKNFISLNQHINDIEIN